MAICFWEDDHDLIAFLFVPWVQEAMKQNLNSLNMITIGSMYGLLTYMFGEKWPQEQGEMAW